MKNIKNILVLNTLIIGFYFLSLNSALRLFLSLSEIKNLSVMSVPFILTQGLWNDLMTLLYFLIPFIFIQLLIPQKNLKRKGPKYILLFVLSFVTFYFILFQSLCEFYFWKEFQSRFDFIAVDYLVYTSEVIGNIKESFNLNLVFSVTAILALILSFFAIHFAKEKMLTAAPSKVKLKLIGLFTSCILLNFTLLPFLKFEFSNNRIVTELSKNGLYELFSAFRNNELDYLKHYTKIPDDQMYSLLQKNLDLQKSPQNKNNFNQLIKDVKSIHPTNTKNIVVILVESLGANFLTRFGNTQSITPYLDQIAEQSISFENLYATGTRTVRGLEAVALSMPPTPGFSILKRTNNENLNGIQQILKKYHYKYDFIYGGYGYFDNMNYFFESNGYGIYDRSDIPSEEILFSNIWGVSDEDLLNFTLKNIDESSKKNQPFFKLILTTSNHRPYSYPDNRIDIPSKSGREGAVKYTDYAIGEFLKKAESKSWFKDTVFVVMADHSADGRGTVSIPLSTYQIPAFIYAPGFINPKKIEVFTSQIDVLPTLFDLLGFEYTKTFLGQSRLTSSEDGKLYLGTYQNVGCYDQKSELFTSLGIKKKVENFKYDVVNRTLNIESLENKELTDFCVALYQYSSLLWKSGSMRKD